MPGKSSTTIIPTGADGDWTRSSFKEIQGFHRRTFLNFAGHGEDSEKLVRYSIGENIVRMLQIKTEYDPDNLFRTNFNISPMKE